MQKPQAIDCTEASPKIHQNPHVHQVNLENLCQVARISSCLRPFTDQAPGPEVTHLGPRNSVISFSDLAIQVQPPRPKRPVAEGQSQAILSWARRPPRSSSRCRDWCRWPRPTRERVRRDSANAALPFSVLLFATFPLGSTVTAPRSIF